MKIKTYKNGWTVSAEAPAYNGLRTVLVRDASGNVHDKVRCDTVAAARDYWRAFNAIAKSA
jgi:hypothetical protein